MFVFVGVYVVVVSFLLPLKKNYNLSLGDIKLKKESRNNKLTLNTGARYSISHDSKSSLSQSLNGTEWLNAALKNIPLKKKKID
ncbi:hypothetical protein BpHYR1_054548 [Brachionus plicatilis]|uniref:Uncharacterized protein n=1 Tax=Brachionus plicatilis TaxID=10195 RepID=A0A3M7SEP6_BRAPC|nr:hypothetical protein BpHYR1_054548 [Brachionus plicatilis]